MKYRQECLSHGGGKPSKQLVSDFLGESFVTPDGLADALIADIDSKNKIVYDMFRAQDSHWNKLWNENMPCLIENLEIMARF